MIIKFRLNEFRDIAKWLDKKLPAPLSFFLKGWLYGLETAWIDAKTVSAVDKAIAPLKPSEPTLTAPTHYTEPSEVEGLDIIGYTYNENLSPLRDGEDPR
jgi:hypothetical protein